MQWPICKCKYCAYRYDFSHHATILASLIHRSDHFKHKLSGEQGAKQSLQLSKTQYFYQFPFIFEEKHVMCNFLQYYQVISACSVTILLKQGHNALFHPKQLFQSYNINQYFLCTIKSCLFKVGCICFCFMLTNCWLSHASQTLPIPQRLWNGY